MFTPPVGDSELLLAVTEFGTVLQQINSENHTSNKWPTLFYQVSLDQSVLGTSSW